MAKLEFRYAVMNSGKSLNLLGVNHNYVSIGRKTVLFSHSFDNRFGESVIASRIGASAPSISITEETNLFDIVKAKVESGEDVACVLTDETQFYTSAQIHQLGDIVDELDIPVIAYGLKTNFQGELFEASKTLLEIADKIEGLKQVCHCGRGATMVLKFNPVDFSVIRSGEIIEIGAEASYVSVCRKHFKAGDIGNMKK